MIFHSFFLADVDDPDICAAGPIFDWQQTDAGKWIMKNSTVIPQFHIAPDMNTYGYRVTITGDLTPKAKTYFTLKYK